MRAAGTLFSIFFLLSPPVYSANQPSPRQRTFALTSDRAICSDLLALEARWVGASKLVEQGIGARAAEFQLDPLDYEGGRPILGRPTVQPGGVVAIDPYIHREVGSVSIRHGVQQLFIRKVYAAYALALIEYLGDITNNQYLNPILLEISGEAEASIGRQFASSLNKLESGLPERPFFIKYEAWIQKHMLEADPNYRELEARKQVGRAKDEIGKWIRAEAKKLVVSHGRQMKEELGAIGESLFREWANSPHALPADDRFFLRAAELFHHHARSLNALCPRNVPWFTEDTHTLAARLRVMLMSRVLLPTPSGGIQLSLPEFGIAAHFDPLFQAIFVHSSSSFLPNESGIVLSLAHGATTLQSNAASWSDLIPILLANGLYSFATDLPGSMGPYGVSFDIAQRPAEMAVYLQNIHASVLHRAASLQKKQVLVGVGRSSGSTYLFTEALFGFLSSEVQLPDVYFLTSFSNPQTIRSQVETVRKQYQSGGRGKLFGQPVPGAFEEITDFNDQLLRDLAAAKTHPDFRQFGDSIFFVQGEADVDGTPTDASGKDVVSALEDFQTRWAPRAHVYVLPDPLKEEAAISALIDPDEREASHFLFSTHSNAAPSKYPAVPEHLLPHFADQNAELLALLNLSLDYRIDLSPLTSETDRERLRAARREITGNDEKYGFFSRFLAGVNAKLKRFGKQVTIDQLRSESAVPGGSHILARFKRVWDFVHREAVGAREFLSANPRATQPSDSRTKLPE